MTLRQRQPRVEDPAWLALVRQMPCLICGYPRSDPAHLRAGSLRYGKRDCGMGEKPDDWWVLPLCRTHHDQQHHRGDELAWWASHGFLDPFATAKELYATRPPQLRPLPAPARPKKAGTRKLSSERRMVGKSRKMESRSTFPPAGTRKLPSRPFPQRTKESAKP